MRIICEGNNPTVKYAAEELCRCLGTMTGGEVALADSGEGIRVGLMSAIPCAATVTVADPEVDDAISIDVSEGDGYIAGINPRSTLLAVYRYLTELGCRWVRPGADGEYIPARESLGAVKLVETPSYRHRGICIEGAVSEEHVKDVVDWMPKVGFNGYFIQFREAHTFFDKWYAHSNNPTLKGEHITIEQAGEITARVVREIKKRDLLYHGVGHGWTCEPFGISGLGWEVYEGDVPEEAVKYLAEVNGERKLWGGIPLNTNLCYGNPKVREIITDEIVSYSKAHPDIDLMHFWLADGSNNHCECELCRDTVPADFFVRMLNDLDAKLTASGLSTRIVFLIYVDLLWPAQKLKISNPERFVLMFAPITRTYSKSFTTDSEIPALPPFVRNKLKFPKAVEENIAFLRAWQKDFTGDSFDYDYHLMWDHLRDPGHAQCSEILYEDILGLKDIGIDGYVSCQVQRASFPTGLPMVTMGRALWNRDLGFDEIASDYFESAYGPDGALARGYLETISELFDPVYLRGEKDVINADAAEKISKVPGVIDEFAAVVERNLGIADECWAKSWFYLKHHAAMCKLLAEAAGALARDDKPTAADAWDKLVDYVRTNEMQLHNVLDVFFYISVLGWRFGNLR